MNQTTLRKIQRCLGIAVFASLAATMGMASVWGAEEWDQPQPPNPPGGAALLPPGTEVICSMSAPGGTGRRKAILTIGDDGATCYREAMPGNVPSSRFTPSCHQIGRLIGCANIETL